MQGVCTKVKKCRKNNNPPKGKHSEGNASQDKNTQADPRNCKASYRESTQSDHSNSEVSDSDYAFCHSW